MTSKDSSEAILTKHFVDCGIDGLTFTLPSRCKPQFAVDCDLGNIVSRFLKTGELPKMVSRPTISDATNQPTDLFEAVQPAVNARQAFDQLSLEERNKYNNDPQAWIEDCVNQTKKGSEEPPKAPEAQEPPKAPGAQEPPKAPEVQEPVSTGVKPA